MTAIPLPPAFHVMTKPRGAICNLDCDYCFYLRKEDLYPGASFRMSDETLETYTRQYIQSQRAPEVNFAWQGGEPTLMGLDFFRNAVTYQKKYARPGMRIENALQTNGTLLDDEWCKFFAENRFLIGISLDGPREAHDLYRRDKGRSPTFERVLRSIALLKKHKVDFNILTCVSAANVHQPLEVYRFLRDEIGAEFIQFIPIVERENETGFQEGLALTPRSITGGQYGDFLIAVFDEWVRRDVGKVFVQMFDTALGRWLGAPGGLCVFQETCGLALAMEHNGDLYSCDHFVEPRYRLGNIFETPMNELVGSERQRAFGLDKKSSLPRYCRECPVLFACNGGCPKDRTDFTPDGEAGLNHLCAGFKAFFTHVDQPMRQMADLLRQRRPPSEIMKKL
ncbi:MAG: Anaerobic sulfatase-maturating enzyme [Anaerolineales bacterium]|nr:Anaerobic sulfatase-maturating enzyme [Anaerolineales bacterium]HAX70250.1 anaerobic sulfatase maturase [Anaerolineae bacterium]HRJ55764.1 anaerobic sulfatase maturase [Anaerolineales bacterium]HRK88074.1 anaerobic sulfatase maturase [Anaerolineales bacterium]